MEGHVDDQPLFQAPAQGLRVRLVGGPADGRTHVIPNADDIRYIAVPTIGDEQGWAQLRYVRVMDKQGLRYVYTED
jgi:hypothetical protein